MRCAANKPATVSITYRAVMLRAPCKAGTPSSVKWKELVNAAKTRWSAFNARCDRAADHVGASSQPRSPPKRVKTATRGRSAFC